MSRPQHLIRHLLIGLIACLLLIPWPRGIQYGGDSPELATVIAEPGIAHPTGYPLYTMLGHAWGRLLGAAPAMGTPPPAGSTPWIATSNAFSFLAMMLAFLGWYFLAIGAHRTSRGGRRLPWLIAGATIPLCQPALLRLAQVTEVYGLHLALLSAGWLLVTRLLQSGATPARVATLSLVCGLGLTHHLTFVFWLPFALLALLAATGWPEKQTPAGPLPARLVRRTLPRLALTAVVFLLGLLPLLYLPWRSEQGPLMNWGTPGTGWQDFIAHITARQYQRMLGGTQPGSQAAWKSLHPAEWAGLALTVPLLLMAAWVSVRALLNTRGWLAQRVLTRHRTRARLIAAALSLHGLLVLIFHLIYSVNDLPDFLLPLWWNGGLLLATLPCWWPRASVPVAETVPLEAPRRRTASAHVAWLIALAMLALALHGTARLVTARELAHQQADMNLVAQAWRDMPRYLAQSPCTDPSVPPLVLMNSMEAELARYLQIVEGIHPDLRMEFLLRYRKPRNCEQSMRELGLVPVVFFDHTTMSDTSESALSLHFEKILRENFEQRYTGPLVYFEADRHRVVARRTAPIGDYGRRLLQAGALDLSFQMISRTAASRDYQRLTGQPFDFEKPAQ